MKTIAICLMGMGMLAGCASGAFTSGGPRPGMAAARVKIVTEQKAGLQKDRPSRVTVYDAAPAPAAPSGQFEHVDYSHLSDIIVWLEANSKSREPIAAPEAAEIEINADKPSDFVHPISVGQKVLIRNTSPRPIALYSVSDGNEFEVPTIAPGAMGQFMAHSPGQIELLADPAKPPVAQAYAAPSAFVSRARSGETVCFNNVPPGDYRVVSWHPRLPGSSTSITLAPDQSAEARLSVGVNVLSQAAR